MAGVAKLVIDPRRSEALALTGPPTLPMSPADSGHGSALLSRRRTSAPRRAFIGPFTGMHYVRRRRFTLHFDPCLPRPADQPPAGPGWIHEIKHDGFRILAHRQGRTIRLISRNDNDLADRFPLAAEAVAALPVRSCVIDGEAIVRDDSGLAVFDLIRGHGRNGRAILCAFDLLEVNGEDVRSEPIEDRKRRLAGLLRQPHEGIALNETYREDGAIIHKHACALGCEAIVSKRLGSPSDSNIHFK